MNENIWMVRAGRGAAFIDDFVDDGFVAVGWDIDLDLPNTLDRDELIQRLRAQYPDESDGTLGFWASTILRYCGELSVGDWVTTYDPNDRRYYVGKIKSDVILCDHDLRWKRDVEWLKQVPRDSLTTGTRNSLGAISTLFLIRDKAAKDMMANSVSIGEDEIVIGPAAAELEVESIDGREEIVNRSADAIEDQIVRLNWEQMQELVSEILVAMGYRTRVSARGADRGVDIFASPDGLGLEEPRIFVEVKHRKGTRIGADQVRAFLGGRQQGDRCLYVSTGGFSKEAKYEADRSSIPITLIALPQLRELLIEHYENMKPEGAALVPLERVYWPV